jgi:hypothetical protein
VHSPRWAKKQIPSNIISIRPQPASFWATAIVPELQAAVACFENDTNQQFSISGGLN